MGSVHSVHSFRPNPCFSGFFWQCFGSEVNVSGQMSEWLSRKNDTFTFSCVTAVSQLVSSYYYNTNTCSVDMPGLVPLSSHSLSHWLSTTWTDPMKANLIPSPRQDSSTHLNVHQSKIKEQKLEFKQLTDLKNCEFFWITKVNLFTHI